MAKVKRVHSDSQKKMMSRAKTYVYRTGDVHEATPSSW